MKFGVREICNVVFRAKSNVKIGNKTYQIRRSSKEIKGAILRAQANQLGNAILFSLYYGINRFGSITISIRLSSAIYNRILNQD